MNRLISTQLPLKKQIDVVIQNNGITPGIQMVMLYKNEFE